MCNIKEAFKLNIAAIIRILFSHGKNMSTFRFYGNLLDISSPGKFILWLNELLTDVNLRHSLQFCKVSKKLK